MRHHGYKNAVINLLCPSPGAGIVVAFRLFEPLAIGPIGLSRIPRRSGLLRRRWPKSRYCRCPAACPLAQGSATAPATARGESQRQPEEQRPGDRSAARAGPRSPVRTGKMSSSRRAAITARRHRRRRLSQGGRSYVVCDGLNRRRDQYPVCRADRGPLAPGRRRAAPRRRRGCDGAGRSRTRRRLV